MKLKYYDEAIASMKQAAKLGYKQAKDWLQANNIK
jgi:hypothetical protein